MKTRFAIPDVLKPVAMLIRRELDGEAEASLVLNDWLSCDHKTNVAHAFWEMTNPSKSQRERTLLIIGRATKIEHFDQHMPKPSGQYDGVHAIYEAFAEAQRQLAIHLHAKWVRYVCANSQSRVSGREAVMDFTHDGNMPPKGVGFRTRCHEHGCIHESHSTQPLSFRRLKRGVDQKLDDFKAQGFIT